MLTIDSKVQLRDGNEMPIVGFGVYELQPEDTYQAVTWALEAGYRQIDSAAWYKNEQECGRAILDFCHQHSLPRSSIFFTTKLKVNEGVAAARRAIQNSLDLCGLGYIDLYLVHGPIGGPSLRSESWQAICEAHTKGLLKNIGVSNYGLAHLQEMLSSGSPLPSVNQIDLHPFMAREAIIKLCREYDIVLQAWAPLVRGMRFEHPAVVELANKYKKEPAQILLRYSLEMSFVPLPKSAHKNRIESNLNIFDFSLNTQDVARLTALDEHLQTDWDPSECE